MTKHPMKRSLGVPRIDDLLDHWGKTNFFSTFDLASEAQAFLSRVRPIHSAGPMLPFNIPRDLLVCVGGQYTGTASVLIRSILRWGAVEGRQPKCLNCYG